MLDRRFPGMPVFLAPCRVQGELAPREIVQAIALLDAHGASDVVIVGRGGGAKEDLYAFDEEMVVRAIDACSVPVVSAVGHEIDVSICDLVADLRAATPSHAAELVVPERAALLQLIDELDGRLQQAVRRLVGQNRARVTRLRLRHPSQRLSEAREVLKRLAVERDAAMTRDVARRRVQVQGLCGRLDALSPLSVLGRGYSVVMHQGQAVRNVSGLAVGDEVDIRSQHGQARATISETRGGDPDSV